MHLLVLPSSILILIFLGFFSLGMLNPLDWVVGASYSVWSPITLKVGRFFYFCDYDGFQRVAEPSLSCRRLTKIVGGMICHHPYLFTLQVAYDRSPEETQEDSVEYAFDEMSTDCLRNAVKNIV